MANIDFAPTLLDAANAHGRAARMDGVSLLPDDPQPAQAARSALIEIEAPQPLFEGDIPVNAWDRPYQGVRTDRYTYVVYTETGEQELYDRRKDPYQLRNVAGDPAYAQDRRPKLAAQLGEARPLQGPLVPRQAVRARRSRPAPPSSRSRRPRVRARGRATLDGLHDARYCEIIELRGAPPNATRDGLEHDRAEPVPGGVVERVRRRPTLAQGARRDTLVVLNGPRHFLMDSVTADAGPRALLPRPAAAQGRDDPDPHGRRPGRRRPTPTATIERDNTWRWKRGRMVFELVAPGGDVYVMQAYSQILDPSLTLGKLRTLGRRLDLPPGWRYRTRRLRSAARARRATATATIVQDELQNTYQLAKTTRRAGKRKRHAVSIDGQDAERAGRHAGHDRGPTARSPARRSARARSCSSGTLAGRAVHRHLPAAVRERLDLRHASTMPFTIAGGEIDFRGTARFTGGTGAYRGITSGDAPGRATTTRWTGRTACLLGRGLRHLLGHDGQRRLRSCRSRRTPRSSRSCMPHALALGGARRARGRCACPRG